MSQLKNLPEHVAIIMDGNGRWAKSKSLPISLGHKQGSETAKQIIEACQNLQIKHLTLYAFSSENWKRPKNEVDNLMQLLHFYIKTERKNLRKSNVKIMVIGNISTLPEKLQRSIKEAETETKNNSGMTLIIALSYGGREEIVHAAKKIATSYKKGTLSLEEIDEKTFTSNLYTSTIPDPDLIIRTSGELRLSNFLLWQSAYAEFYFSKTNWPDFTVEDLKKALMEYKKRKRNYGS